jgi:hypothetical protein
MLGSSSDRPCRTRGALRSILEKAYENGGDCTLEVVVTAVDYEFEQQRVRLESSLGWGHIYEKLLDAALELMKDRGQCDGPLDPVVKFLYHVCFCVSAHPSYLVVVPACCFVRLVVDVLALLHCFCRA